MHTNQYVWLVSWFGFTVSLLFMFFFSHYSLAYFSKLRGSPPSSPSLRSLIVVFSFIVQEEACCYCSLVDPSHPPWDSREEVKINWTPCPSFSFSAQLNTVDHFLPPFLSLWQFGGRCQSPLWPPLHPFLYTSSSSSSPQPLLLFAPFHLTSQWDQTGLSGHGMTVEWKGGGGGAVTDWTGPNTLQSGSSREAESVSVYPS